MQMKQKGPDCGSEFTNALGKVKKIKQQFCLTSKKPLSVLPPKKEEGKCTVHCAPQILPGYFTAGWPVLLVSPT